MREKDLDGIPQVDGLAAEGYAAHVGQEADLFAPSLYDFPGGDVALLRAEQFEVDGRDVGLGVPGRHRGEPSAFAARSLANGHRDAG